ncbi:putative C2H2 finger domain protein [Aspergillus clavatus NRRL 1]|uniref:C2H2 finger domain protein, putative n=1 Tax=Aspergillus clavatus (strain ATCC 1007 / CBS 513.65 / DSM 816 / NCTC 3887 / NRRL 1 / QM 1276 / 107) TaxID=344612 RepID=A1CRT6_ASPCL|nr:C2H2 finger domain protein, putative [Aspergillus clavatus NRRL 1]EAW08357.1 C2H2 finger domain protein, putative [Aspergillus clavatus NRRL 1]
MGKKRRGPTLDELLARPWCYYCERDFDDLKILISHQKAKHFKCERCGRRLNTAGGLSVHMSQVHKEQLSAVDNALPNRSGLDVEIFGMEGVPEDVVQSHNQRVIAQFQQAEAERQAVTGNPPAGTTSGGQPAKKPKLENVSDLKKRLAEHKAKRAEAVAGGSSGEATPVGAGQTQALGGFAQSPQSTAAPTPQFTYSQPYGGATSPFQQSASPVYPNFSPTAQAPYPPVTQYPPAGYSPQSYQAGTPAQPTPVYGSTPPPFPPQPHQQAPPSHMPPQITPSFPQRPGSLPAAPSLPQRPAFGAPQVNAYQMQQMHMGHPIPSGVPPTAPNGSRAEASSISSSVNDLVSGAAKEADQAAAAAKAGAGTTEEKPSKKDKGKPTRLVYSDNDTSPEEKMARLPRYAFVPDHRGETTLGELPGSVVVGTIRDSDTIFDPAQ